MSQYDDWDYEQLGLKFNMSVEGLYAWARSFEPAYIIAVATNEDEQTELLYTDGDDGMMLLSESCQEFDNGVNISINGNYCCLDLNTINKMLTNLNKAIKANQYVSDID